MNELNLKQSWIALAILFVAFAMHIGRFVNDFYVPESDFFDFRDKAITLRQGEWPEDFKRPPLYSASIAAISAVIPGPQRELVAAEFIGVVAVLTGFFLFFAISRNLFSYGALLLTWFWAFHPSTVRMAVKPKSEMLVTVLILLAFYLFLKEKRWAYTVGFLASMVRYEGALIIAAIGVADFLTRPHKLRTFFLSLLAVAGILIWTFLPTGGTEGGSYFSYFDNYEPNFAFLKTFWSSFLGFLPADLFKLWVVLGVVLMTLGVLYLFSLHLRAAFGLMTFFVGFLLMHIVWPMPNFDYQVVIAWCAILMIAAGAVLLWRIVTQKLLNAATVQRFVAHPFVLAIAALVTLFTVIYLVVRPVPFPQYRVGWAMMMVFLLPVLLGLWLYLKTYWEKPLAPLLFSVTVFVLCSYFIISRTNAQQYDIRYSKAEFRLVGEWFNKNAEPTDKLVVEQPVVVGYYTSFADSSFIRLVDLPRTEPEALHQWLQKQNITYIAWLSANRIFETDNAWYEWKMENRGWKNIEFLGDGKSSNGFTLVKELKIGPRWAYIYKI